MPIASLIVCHHYIRQTFSEKIKLKNEMPRISGILYLPCTCLIWIVFCFWLWSVFRNSTTCFLWAFLLLRLLWAIHKEFSIFTLVNLQTNFISV